MSQQQPAKEDSKQLQADVKSATKRLQKELMSLMTAKVQGVSAFPVGDDVFGWVGTIKGIQGTPYEEMEYKLSLKFSPKYPYTPPTVKFETSCFHPNVDQYGNICLDILKVCVVFVRRRCCCLCLVLRVPHIPCLFVPHRSNGRLPTA